MTKTTFGNDNETEVTKTQRNETSADITKLADHKVNKHSTIGLDKKVNIWCLLVYMALWLLSITTDKLMKNLKNSGRTRTF